jgi:hypothetical protein
MFLRRLGYFAVLTLIVAGCASDSSRRMPWVEAHYVETTTPVAGPAIQILATDRQPLTSAELVLPNGETVQASLIERDNANGYEYRPAPSVGVGVGVFGGSHSGVGTGISLGFPVFGYDRGPDLVRSRARIPITDLDTYRQVWGQSVARLQFGTEPNANVMEIPAPSPGPGGG